MARAPVRAGHQALPRDAWTAMQVQTANVQATVTKAAVASIRNVCTAITVVGASGATAPTAVNLTVNLIDGASGGTTYLWRATLSIPATAGETRGVTISGLWLPGSINTGMTLEFSAAGGANTLESVAATGEVSR